MHSALRIVWSRGREKNTTLYSAVPLAHMSSASLAAGCLATFLCLLCVVVVPVVRGQTCLPTFPAVDSCLFTNVPAVGIQFFLNNPNPSAKSNSYVLPSAVTLQFQTSLLMLYTVTGQFTHLYQNGSSTTVTSTVSWRGWWITFSSNGETCGCACTGVIQLATETQIHRITCADSYHLATPDSYNFCNDIQGLAQYSNGMWSWALNQDTTNKFLMLSTAATTASGGAVGSAIYPYSSTPGSFWGQQAAYLSESGIC